MHGLLRGLVTCMIGCLLLVMLFDILLMLFVIVDTKSVMLLLSLSLCFNVVFLNAFSFPSSIIIITIALQECNIER